MGPFNSKLKAVARSLMNKFTLVTVRDENSFKALQHLDLVGVPIYLTADIGFLYSGVDKVNASNIIKNECINIDNIERPLIGITFNFDVSQTILSKENSSATSKKLLLDFGRLCFSILPHSVISPVIEAKSEDCLKTS